MEAQPEITQNISSLKLPMLKTGDYDLWSMRIEQYLTHTDYALWEVIINGDSHVPEPPAVGTVVPPKTEAQKLARKNKLKAKSTLLLAIPDEHLLKFHSIKDVKSLWEAIKIRFGGNKESKKMHKIILKQQYENFVASRSQGLDKNYDRFQKLIRQLKLNGEVISQEYANMKLLRSLLPAWNNIALIMRNKPDIETLSMDDLYNNLKVYEAEIKGKSSSGSNSHNVAFVSCENTSSINEIVTAAHDILLLVAMIIMRVKKFMKRTGRNLNFNGQEPVSFDKTKVECYNRHRRGHFARECCAPRNQGNRSADNETRVVPVETPASALVTHQIHQILRYNLAQMNVCFFFENLQKQYDQQTEILNRSNLEIPGYQYGLESLEERIRVHQKNETVFKESIALLKYDVQVRDILIKDLTNQLEKTMKEQDDLKEKLTKFEESSKNLTKLINSQMSANDKTGLGYDSQLSENEMPKCEIFKTASDSSVSEIDEDNNQAKDRYKVGIGYHAVPPTYAGFYMPPRADLSFARLDDSVLKFKISETRTSVNENESIASKSGEETREEPKTVRKRQDSRVDWNGMKTQKQGIGFEFNKRVCFVRESVNRIIKDCTFYDNKMVEKYVVNNKGKGTGQMEVRPVWNNARRVNHQNFSKMTHPHPKRNFIPTAVATKSGQVLVNAAKQNSAASTSTARPKVSTAAIRPNVNAKSSYFKPYFSKRMHFNQRSAAKTNTFSRQINTAKRKIVTTARPKAVVNAAEGKKETAVKTSADFKLLDESQVLLKVPRQNNMYNFDLKNVVPSGDLTCLFEKAIIDESNLWHRRLSHINFKTLNKLMRGNLSSDVNAGDQPGDVNAGDQPGDVNAGDIQGDVDEISRNYDVCQGNEIRIDSSTHAVNAASTSINTDSNIIAAGSLNINTADSHHTNMPTLEATGIFNGAFDDRDLGAEANTNNLDSSIVVSPTPTSRVHKDHPKEHIIGDPNLNTQTRRMINFLRKLLWSASLTGRKGQIIKIFRTACLLVFCPKWNPKRAIGSKWVFRNKFDKKVARIEAIRLFLEYASFKYFIVYQMDVKRAFLYGKIDEEVYVCQPLGFEDPDFPYKVYKVKKALYGLHQAPRAWYETLSTYLLNNRFKRGQVDKTLFIKRDKGDILLVQVYVDDIIFRSTKKEMCGAFEILMHEKFQMSSMGELTFFLGLQVKQKQDGIFISEDKYVTEILNKFGFFKVKTATTLMETLKPLLKDEDGQEVYVHIYRSMIGSLMYLTSSRPDIMFIVCAYARHQVSPKVSRLHTVKMIFRYLKGKPKLGLWYPKDSPFELEAYTDSNYARSSLDRQWLQTLQLRLSMLLLRVVVDRYSGYKINYLITENYALLVLVFQTTPQMEDASKHGRMIEEIDQNAEIALDDETQRRTNDDEIAASTTDATEDEITMAQALAALKSIKPKVVVQEQKMSTTIPTAATTVTTAVPTPRARCIVFHEQKQSEIPTVSSSKDKGKAKMIDHEVPLKKKEQMRIDEEYARKLQAEEQEAARLSRAQ
nr:hypothetical protein [Tanacetum cinerariifolium]